MGSWRTTQPWDGRGLGSKESVHWACSNRRLAWMEVGRCPDVHQSTYLTRLLHRHSTCRYQSLST